jgi:hypothetical protein
MYNGLKPMQPQGAFGLTLPVLWPNPVCSLVMLGLLAMGLQGDTMTVSVAMW